jgi:hypothetical protein
MPLCGPYRKTRLSAKLKFQDGLSLAIQSKAYLGELPLKSPSIAKTKETKQSKTILKMGKISSQITENETQT